MAKNSEYIPLKYCVDLVNVKSDDVDDRDTYIGLEHIQSWTGKYIPNETEKAEGVLNEFKVGDVLFGKLRPYLAKVYKAEFNGYCSSEALVLRSKKDVAPAYLKYFLLSDSTISKIDSSTYGAKMPRANWDFIGSMPFPQIPLAEQQSIAAFLDKKTEQIDDLIEQKEKLLSLLIEKRMAIITQAVTKRPGWEVWKLKHAYSKIGSGSTPKSDNPEYYNGDIPWITTSELRENVIMDTDAKVTEQAVNDVGLKIYSKGSVAIAMYGATIGRLGILGIDATVNQACCVFDGPKEFYQKFLYYWLWANRDVLISLSSGGGQPNLSQDDLKKLRIPIPRIAEQKEISSRLDKKVSELICIENKVSESIEKLKEYRKSVITSAISA